MKQQVEKKLAKGKSVSEIAEALEEEEETIREILQKIQNRTEGE